MQTSLADKIASRLSPVAEVTGKTIEILEKQEGKCYQRQVCLAHGYVVDSRETKMLGAGTYATVISVLLHNQHSQTTLPPCNSGTSTKTSPIEEKEKEKEAFAMKSIKIHNSCELEISYRDLFFLEWFKTKSKDGFVPFVYKRCADAQHHMASIVMEKFDCNLNQLMIRTANDFYSVTGRFPICRFIIREEHLKAMFRIIGKLDWLHVVHGDLRPDQFLWRKSDDKIVLTDFGFAGFTDGDCDENAQKIKSKPLQPYLGWPVQPSLFGCCGTKGDMEAKIQALDESHILHKLNLLKWLNIWELDAILWYLNVHVLVQNENDDINNKHTELKRYGRVCDELLPPDVELQFQSLCINKTTWSTDRVKQLNQPLNRFYVLRYEDL